MRVKCWAAQSDYRNGCRRISGSALVQAVCRLWIPVSIQQKKKPWRCYAMRRIDLLTRSNNSMNRNWMNRFRLNRIVMYSQRFAMRLPRCLWDILRITLDRLVFGGMRWGCRHWIGPSSRRRYGDKEVKKRYLASVVMLLGLFSVRGFAETQTQEANQPTVTLPPAL